MSELKRYDILYRENMRPRLIFAPLFIACEFKTAAGRTRM